MIEKKERTYKTITYHVNISQYYVGTKKKTYLHYYTEFLKKYQAFTITCKDCHKLYKKESKNQT